MSGQIAENLEKVRLEIAGVAEKAGRNPEDIQLLAVSKTKPASMVIDAVNAGQFLFGENKLQGSPEKIEEVKETVGELNDKVSWHFIGSLQANKVRKVLTCFDIIHSLDSEKLIDRVDRIAGEMGIKAQGLFQVNVSGSVSQSGVGPHLLYKLIDKAAECKNIEIKGLMAIGPLDDNEFILRRAFERIRLEAERINERKIENISMDILSMGMSGDFKYAIEEGSTLVRIGTAIFGPRNY